MYNHTPRTLTAQQRQEFFNTLPSDIDKLSSKILFKLFSRNYKTDEPNFYLDDLIVIGPAEYEGIPENSLTTTGIYLFNKYLIEELKVISYINHTLKSDDIDKIFSVLGTALRGGLISIDMFRRFVDKFLWFLGGPMAHVISVSISRDILTLPKESHRLKDKLIEENRQKIDDGDPIISSEIEKAVCADAYERLRNVDGFALFDSDAVKFDNNYKTMFVMKGAIVDNIGEHESGYKTITSNYNEGITKEDMPKISDSLVTSAYSKGHATQDAGYSGKKYISRFQNIKVGPKGSDCKSDGYDVVLLTKENMNRYLYRYIIEGKELVLLDDDTILKYIGKEVKMRGPKYCKRRGCEYCNICFGEMPYILDTPNVGLQFNIATGNVLNADMKKFHDVTIKTYQLDIEKDFLQFPSW